MGKALFLLFKNECGCHPINPLNPPTRHQPQERPLIPDADKINLLILENLFNFVAYCESNGYKMTFIVTVFRRRRL
jgi:hypothetical protein